MKKSMDLFGEALWSYYQGNKSDKFYFKHADDEPEVFDLSHYFEGRDKLKKIGKTNPGFY